MARKTFRLLPARLPAAVTATLRGAAVCAALGTTAAWGQYLPDPGFGDPYATGGYGDANAALNRAIQSNPALPPNFQNGFGPGAPMAPTTPNRPASWPGGSADPARAPATTAGMPAPDTSGRGAMVDYRVARSLPPHGLSAPPAAAQRKSPADPPYDPAEIIGHVNNEVIQASEVLLNVNQYITAMTKEHAAELARLTPEERAEQLKPLQKELVRRALDEIIKVKLLVSELKQKVPAEGLKKFDTQVRSHFNTDEIKRLMDEHHAVSIPDLENKLRALGTSIDAQRTVYVERNLAGGWLQEHTKADPAPPTPEQLLAYYKKHSADWDVPARVRWEQITAKFDSFNSKAEAYRAIAQWGTEVWRGAPFAAVAKAHSQDFASEEGGVHDWASRGSLRSATLEEALFSLPAGKLSVIIEDEDGFHIVRVLEREEGKRTPFTEVQPEIKKALQDSSKEKRQAEYFAKLRERSKVMTIFDEDFVARTTPQVASPPGGVAPSGPAAAAPPSTAPLVR